MLSIVVPCYNNHAFTAGMVSVLLATLEPANIKELVLISDGSTDGTAAWLESLNGPFIRTYHSPENYGFAVAVNKGVELAQSNLVVIANNDFVLQKQTFPKLIEALRHVPENFGVVGNIQRRVSNNSVHHAGMYMSEEGLFLHKEEISAEPVSQCDLVTGALMLFRRSVFLEVGGFDEAYRNGCEDIDLCLRLLEKGHTNWVANYSMVHHHVAATRGVSIQEQYNLQRLLTVRRPELKKQMKKNHPHLDPDPVLDLYLNRVTQRINAHEASRAAAVA